ncbi:MAG TPA: hypothetical protein PLA80_12050 [Synergistaceae bacterium]|nr:hypothetical protein [Synergistaceae bacterium]
MIAFFRRMLVKSRSVFLGGFLLGGIFSGAWAQEPILDFRRAPEEDYCYVVTSEPGGLYGLSFSDFENLGGALSEDALYSLSLSPEGDLLLATFQEVLFSRNRGRTWSSLRGGGDLKNFYVTPQGTFVGVSWRKGFLWASRENPEFQEASGEMGDFVITEVLETPSGELWGATFGGGVFTSSDGGRSWKSRNEGLENVFVLSLAWDASKEILYAGTYEGGVFRRSRRGAWEAFSRGLPERAIVQALEMDSEGLLWGGTHEKGVFRASFEGEWRPFSGKAEDASLTVNVLERFGGGMLGGTRKRGLLFAAPGAAAWVSLEISDPLEGFGETSDGTLLALSRSGILYEAARKEGPWKERGRIESSFPCRGLMLLSDRIFLAGTSRGSWLSEDGGESWIFRSFPAPSEEERSGEFAPPPGEWGGLVGMVKLGSSVMAATTYKGLFRSSGGWSWSLEEGREAIEGRYLYSIASDGESRIALGTNRGLSYSRDSGNSWINIYVSYGLSSVLFDDSGTLWGVSRNGIWRFVPPEMEPETVRIAGYSWSPTVYFTELLSGEEGSLLGLLKNDLVRLLPEGKRLSLQKIALKNVEILSSLRLSSGGMLLGSERGFYFSEDPSGAWQEGHVPRNLFHLSEGR